MQASRSKLVVGVIAVVLATACGCRARVEGKTRQERIDSIVRLADQQPWGAGDAIISAARDDSDPTVRYAAIIALVRFTGSKYRDVVDAAVKDSAPEARRGAAIALGRYGDDAAVETLGKLMNTDADEDVRAVGATGLGCIARPKSIVLLARAMGHSDSPKVKLNALRAISMRYKIKWGNEPDPGDAAGWAEAVRIVNGLAYVKHARKVVAEESERN